MTHFGTLAENLDRLRELTHSAVMTLFIGQHWHGIDRLKVDHATARRQREQIELVFVGRHLGVVHCVTKNCTVGQTALIADLRSDRFDK